jgi:dTDP-4-amino-4,6-dideoxygalactose transaminase
MDILVHRDVFLKGLLKNEGGHGKGAFITRAQGHPELKLWVCADAVRALADALFALKPVNEARDVLDQLCQRVTVVPLRQEDIVTGFNAGLPLETGIMAGIAKRYKIPVLVMPSEEQEIDADGLQVCSVAKFWQMIDTHPDEEKQSIVPFLDLHAQLHQIYNPIDARFTDIIANTGYILGPHVKEFEEGFAHLQDAGHCLGVSNGTAALHIALTVLGVGPGDRVIVPVNTFIATAEAVTLTGAEPIFIDCDETSNIDVQACHTYLEALRSEGADLPKAIIPVHLYGQLADMDAVESLAQEYGLDIVEDACQAHLATWSGHRAGHWGKFAAFSFYPGKNLGAFGEGGALITNDGALHEAALSYRQHGENKRYFHRVAGHNYRMEAFQGAVLAEKLGHIEAWTALRKEHAKRYTEYLSDVERIELPKVRSEAECVFHLYVIHAQQRDELKAYLESKGISCGLHYPMPLHQQPAYSDLHHPHGFPVAEKAATQLLSLPMYPELSKHQIEHVCQMVREFYETHC